MSGDEERQPAYAEAANRCFADGDVLHGERHYANASHLFGLGAECALKALLGGHPGLATVPYKHLPELRDDVLRMLSGRRYNGIRQLLNINEYMRDWEIGNRYWPSAAFSSETSALHRDHCRRTLYASGVRRGV